ncbi:hypothetical protein K456DRAFT_511751 [Colletotrichum gloeosporioides 23]|nr:hypothetical protein K456DRAFT_511751 [Colletotrichum gloeosporioides 23]
MWPFPSHVCFTSPTTSATGSGYDRIAKEGTESRHFDTPTKIQPYTHRQAKHTIPTSTFLPRRLKADRAALFFFVAAGVFYTTDNRIFSSPIILSSPLRSHTKNTRRISRSRLSFRHFSSILWWYWSDRRKRQV